MMKLADWGGGGSRERKRRTEADGGAQTYPAAPAYPAAGTAQTKPRYDNHDVLHGLEPAAGAATAAYRRQRNAPETDAWGSAQRSGGFGLTVTDVDAPGGARKLTKRSTWQRDGSGIKSGWDYVADTTRAQTDAFADSRAGKIISGAMDSANAGYANAAGTLNDYFNRYYPAPTVFDDRGNVDWEASVRAHRPSETVQAAVDRLHDRADALQMRGAQRLTEAKDGLGRVGQTLVDAGAAGTQMLGDAALNMIVPGGGLLAMGARAFGNAAAEARKAGADVARQAGYGAAAAGVEILSEKLFDGLAGIYGAGAADDFVERVISKMTKSAGGQRVLRMFASGLGEAGEEVISGLIDPALKAIVDGQGVFSSTHYNADTRADIAHSALVASILGGLGGAVELAGENSRSAKAAREENSIAENRGSAYSNGKENASPMNHDPAPKGEPFVEEPGYMYLGTMDHIMEVADSFPKSFQSLLQNGWLEASNEEAMKFGYHTLEEKETGLRIRFDEGRIGENGFRGRDHYHIFNPYATGNSDLYLDANGVPTNKKGKHSHILPKGD